MPKSVNHDRSHGHSRTGITRRRHRADSISPGGTRGLVPKRRCPSSNGFRNRNPPLVAHATESIRCAVHDLRPLAVSIVEPGSADLRLFNCLLSRYPYLGHRNTVGENIRYLVRDRTGRPVRGTRCLDRLGSRQTGGEPRFPD